jgi:zinc protease
MAEAVTQIHRTEVDGVPAFWVDGPGPCFAGLLFRVGKIDEQLYTTGITHLVEHLALPGWAPKPGLDWNGWVGLTTTGFWASGDPADVGAFVTEVTRQLHDLPLERLETERNILRAEEASGSRHSFGVVAGRRFGAVGIALLDWLELGLRAVDATTVAAWAAERFTRGNAALWLNGTPPPELRLHLPDGPRIPPPRYDEPPEELPAFSRWGRGGITLSLFAPRSFALGLAWRAAEQRALQRLRYERGLIYGLGVSNQPPNKYDAHVVFIVECTDENVDAVRAGLIDVLEEIATDGPTEEERDHWLRRVELDAADPHMALGIAHAYAEDLLLDDERTLESDLIEMQSVTAADAAAALRAGLDKALLLIPEEDAAEPPPPFRLFEPAPIELRIEGRKFSPGGIRGRLGRAGHAILGEDGFAWQQPDGTQIAVAFADCVGLLSWRDGSFQLIDPNGNYLIVGVNDVRNLEELSMSVRRAVPPERVIPMD